MTHAGRFVPAYSPELAQYVVMHGEVRVVPTKAHPEDDTRERAVHLADALTRVYARDGVEFANSENNKEST